MVWRLWYDARGVVSGLASVVWRLWYVVWWYVVCGVVSGMAFVVSSPFLILTTVAPSEAPWSPTPPRYHMIMTQKAQKGIDN